MSGTITRQDRKLLWWVYALVVVFGSCSWLSVNSIWLELPIMVNSLPESWGLPSFLSVIVQLACIGPLVYGLAQKAFPRLPTPPIITGAIAFGCLSTLLLAFFWHRTSYVADADRSVALFVLFFGMSLVNCTSNVLFLPYMAVFKPGYMTAYFIGMGISGLVPSLLSLAQGAGKMECVETLNVTSNTSTTTPVSIPPKFSVGAFNGLMFVWMSIALASFCLLNWLPKARAEMVARKRETEEDQEEEEATIVDRNSGDYQTNGSNGEPSTPDEKKIVRKELPLREYAALLVTTFWVCSLMNGVLPSIQSYSCLPYGQDTYHFAVAFSNIANPIACFIPFFYNPKTPRDSWLVILLCSGLATTISAFIIALASLSPSPPLLATTAGSVICVSLLSLVSVCVRSFLEFLVLVWVIDWGLLAYLRTVMAGKLREAAGDSERRLFWCGAATQLGSFLGALIMFPLINVLHLFKSAPACPS